MIPKILTTVGSVITICFGLWHFFVPSIWKWYSYIDTRATELVIAVRAINIVFSLSLVLFGIINILFINGSKSNRYSIIVMLLMTIILWLTRTILQLIFPQGSVNPVIQYGMLATFIIVTILYLVSLYLIVFQKNVM